ncbi:MAG: DUF922 domain-containing protein [Archangium sp.]
MRRVLLLVNVLWLTACPPPAATLKRTAWAIPQSTYPNDTQVRWYDVEGDDEHQLRANLDAIGPEDAKGERHDAYTSWYVTWRFPFSRGDDGCTTGPVTTDVRVVMTLPRWLGPADPNHPMVKKWRSYLDSLVEHESGHRDTGFRAATEITELLPNLAPQQSCDDAEAKANETARAVLEKFRTHDAAYDEDTRHGATQGAVFP